MCGDGEGRREGVPRVDGPQDEEGMAGPAGLQLDLLTALLRLAQIGKEGDFDRGHWLWERVIGCDLPRLAGYLEPATVAWCTQEERALLQSPRLRETLAFLFQRSTPSFLRRLVAVCGEEVIEADWEEGYTCSLPAEHAGPHCQFTDLRERLAGTHRDGRPYTYAFTWSYDGPQGPR
jgi:hypothetical protein